MTEPKTDTDTVAQLESRQAAIKNDLEAAGLALAEARNDLGDAALGTDPDKTAKAAEVVQQRQQDVQRLQAVCEALDRRLLAAREREGQEAMDARWDAFAEALAQRDAMFEAAEQTAAPFFEAVLAAIDASESADKLAPLERLLTPDGWRLMPKPFTGMANMKNEELVIVRNALRDMAAKSRTATAEALQLRQYDKPDRVTQFGDPASKTVVIEPTA